MYSIALLVSPTNGGICCSRNAELDSLAGFAINPPQPIQPILEREHATTTPHSKKTYYLYCCFIETDTKTNRGQTVKKLTEQPAEGEVMVRDATKFLDTIKINGIKPIDRLFVSSGKYTYIILFISTTL